MPSFHSFSFSNGAENSLSITKPNQIFCVKKQEHHLLKAMAGSMPISLHSQVFPKIVHVTVP